ncbi:hypothetical protein [Streptomyces sp. SID13726]|uniref:hypothetical protein n=1 Tax=Streptomyces sp. SID13726 TaxID=2706058 RepID=UPI0013BB1B2B|nr:hypothetical protein [Streptomyces sp. SID13726]NEA99038.1 hypothetical protein [Streptomyces sp. SID13726]
MILRDTALRVSLAACLLADLSACGAAGGEIRSEGPAPSRIPWTGPVYALDWQSLAWPRPDTMDLTADTVLWGVKWHDWGSPRATGTGSVLDLACRSGCPHGDYPHYAVTIVFSGLVKRQYAAYYSHAAVTPVHPPAPGWAEDVRGVALHVPKP